MTARVAASAPGKVVLLGEYVVLDGAPALVAAVERRCTVELRPAPGARCGLEMRMPEPVRREFAPGEPSGSGLVDALGECAGLAPPWPAWRATIDTSAFFSGPLKLGLGSSAAALVAFAGACGTAAGRPGSPGLSALIAAHRAFQGGAGSGIDVAAALTGGCLRFEVGEGTNPRIVSVRPPKSVGFAGIFAGGSASTPDLVGRYRRWADSAVPQAAALRQRMRAVAARGCDAVRDDDGEAFVAAIGDYGRCLGELGDEMGADLVTSAHRQIADLAAGMGLAYKVSGAGGGDVGFACGLDRQALRSFSGRAADAGFQAVPLAVDEQGLVVEERAE